MAQQQMGGYTSSNGITINPEEMTHIAKDLLAIAGEFEHVIGPAINTLKSANYVTAGDAKKTMESVPDANERVLELRDHYERSSTLVFQILNEMVQADEKIGQEIAAALNIGGGEGNA
ncbi:hypothetical protein MFLO_01925 [Listeria floridensis FSL S10-1187]|uniref:PE domain-containing protein n=1 Tax=Listeria floridensis FSL S10-1187 TaxID=1265817 RepID=A0ABN0RJ27_9LIST|nr:hypothetical protein [Listeria floridensis]EUJ33937.1 hypothetical protein MFLO_01925 [Listeria floridensis FSL S10-1187]